MDTALDARHRAQLWELHRASRQRAEEANLNTMMEGVALCVLIEWEKDAKHAGRSCRAQLVLRRQVEGMGLNHSW